MGEPFAKKVLVLFKNIGKVIEKDYIQEIAPELENIVLLSYYKNYRNLTECLKPYQIISEHGTITTRALSIIIGKIVRNDEINNLFFPLEFPLSEIWININEANKATVVLMLNQLAVCSKTYISSIDIAQTETERKKIAERLSTIEEKGKAMIDTKTLNFKGMLEQVKEVNNGPTFTKIATQCIADMEEATKECNGQTISVVDLASVFQKRITKGEISPTDLWNVISEIISDNGEVEDEEVD